MMLPVKLEELAELMAVPLEQVVEIRDAGYLDPDQDGLCDESDALRLALLVGLPEGTLEERLGLISATKSPLIQRLFGPNLQRYTLEEASELVGLSVEDLRAMETGMGMWTRTLDAFDIESLHAGRRMMDAGFPMEAMHEGARVYSDALRKLTDAEMSMVHRYFCGSLTSSTDVDLARALPGAMGMFEPGADRLLEDTLSDHRIRAIATHLIDHLEAAKRGSSTTSLEVSILFVDLSLFTALTEAEGDEAAALLLDRFDRAVRACAVRHRGALAKQIGDAFMLTFSAPVDAVGFALDLEQGDEDLPEVRIGIHHGPVLHRVGDYVGQTVNVASRVTAMAMPGTILVTEIVAKEASDAGIDVEAIGVRRARGSDQPIALYRVLPGTVRTDPVCGRSLGPEATAHLRHEGAELVFCSHDCLRSFLDDPAHYVRSP